MEDWSAAANAEFLPEEEVEFINLDVDFESLLKVSSGSADVTESLHRGLTSTEEGIVEEEELEWLSNKDAFLAIESCFGILSDNPELIVTNRSPDSVRRCNGVSGFRVPRNPVRHRSSIPRKKRTYFREFSSDKSSQLTVENESPLPVPKITGRNCLHCGSDKTPQWRTGPMGPKTLCNACGVRYKSGRLLPEYRPANSPTFSSSLHSNWHGKVVEMRKQKQLAGGGSTGSIYNSN